MQIMIPYKFWLQKIDILFVLEIFRVISLSNTLCFSFWVCWYCSLKKFFSLSVSKTTKELLLTWESKDDKPVIVADDLRMPQFEMQKIASDKCHETNHMGKFKILIILDPFFTIENYVSISANA